MPVIQHGRNTQVLLQKETAFRTAPAAAAFAMKFNTLRMNDTADRVDDPTIENNLLSQSPDDGDQAIEGELTAIYCLNDIGHWLSLLWGNPVTTGTGPYTHTFTLNFNQRPTALLELGYLSQSKYPRYLGVHANSLSIDMLAREQNISVGLMAATEVDPVPTTVFDGSPTQLAKNRASAIQGLIEDVSGSSTLGSISGGTLEISNNTEGLALADGLAGYGIYDLGDMFIRGTVRALLADDSSLLGYQEANTQRPLILTSKNKAGDASMVVNLPAVNFDKPTRQVETSRGIFVDAAWQAHENATPPTIVLINGIASY